VLVTVGPADPRLSLNDIEAPGAIRVAMDLPGVTSSTATTVPCELTNLTEMTCTGSRWRPVLVILTVTE
jgi:hypothetical protein